MSEAIPLYGEGPLRRPLDSNLKADIDAAITGNPNVSESELSEVFGVEALEAYASDPNALVHNLDFFKGES